MWSEASLWSEMSVCPQVWSERRKMGETCLYPMFSSRACMVIVAVGMD